MPCAQQLQKKKKTNSWSSDRSSNVCVNKTFISWAPEAASYVFVWVTLASVSQSCWLWNDYFRMLWLKSTQREEEPRTFCVLLSPPHERSQGRRSTSLKHWSQSILEDVGAYLAPLLCPVLLLQTLNTHPSAVRCKRATVYSLTRACWLEHVTETDHSSRPLHVSVTACHRLAMTLDICLLSAQFPTATLSNCFLKNWKVGSSCCLFVRLSVTQGDWGKCV